MTKYFTIFKEMRKQTFKVLESQEHGKVKQELRFQIYELRVQIHESGD